MKRRTNKRRRRNSEMSLQAQMRHRLVVERLEQRLCLTVPVLSSLPGADHTIFLDFDGHTVENTYWNSSYYNQSTLVADPFDIDGNPSTFNATELARIEESWKRTAEDFRPFNVNVTTVDPGAEALRNSGGGDTQWGVRAIVTKESTMVSNSSEYCGCGGVAYIGSFDWGSDTPVWVYTTGGKSIGEAASHEVGHSLDLSHDGLSSGTTYYRGHGSGETGWAPIMGVGYYENVTQWDRGDYYNSNNGGSNANYGNGPDDLAIITTGHGFGYRNDDHGDTDLTASPIGVFGTTVSDSGIIETTTDVDVFRFTTGAGLVTLNINPFTPGPNLDVKASLYDGSGNPIATSSPASTLDASFSLNLDAGQYFLHVDGTGVGDPTANPPSGYSDYASLGQYSIGGSIVDPGGLPTVGIADASADENANSMTFTVSISDAAEENTTVDWATINGTATASLDYAGTSGSATILAGQTSTTITVNLIDDSTYEGDETFSLNLSNPSGLVIGDSQAIGTIIENDPLPLPTVAIDDSSLAEGKFHTKGKHAGTPSYSEMSFTISLSSSSSQTVTVDYTTADGSATGASVWATSVDYLSETDTVTFSPGETSKTVTVTIAGDNDIETPDEIFTVVLGNPVNATIGDGSATGTIIDDDSGGGNGGGKGGGGNGNGGGRGGKNQSSALSVANPVAVADPIWFFEGPEVGDHDHRHVHDDDHHHLHDDHLTEESAHANQGMGDRPYVFLYSYITSARPLSLSEVRDAMTDRLFQIDDSEPILDELAVARPNDLSAEIVERLSTDSSESSDSEITDRLLGETLNEMAIDEVAAGEFEWLAALLA